MAESQRDLTLVPGFDLSEIAKSAARVQGILDSMSGDFTKFDEKTIAVLDNVSRAMKDLKATMQSLSMTIQASMSESTNSLDINALKSNIDAIKQNMESLMTAFQNVGDTSGLAESIKTQLNQIRADISQATADIISQFAGLVDKINGIAKGININLNSPLKGKQFEELQRIIELVQKPVVTSWDVTSMVAGLDAISERINAINPDLLQRYADLANTALKMPEIIPPAGGTVNIPGIGPDDGGDDDRAARLAAEMDELLQTAEFRTKTITTDLASGRQTLTGILSDGRVLTQVIDEEGNTLKATLRTTQEIQIQATDRLNQLKAATAELDRQRIAYEKIAKSPYASDAEKQSALAGLENARTALQELMGGFDAAMTDVLGSSLDKALEQARTKLATSFTSVEDTLSSVAVKQVDASLKKIENAYSQLEKLYATPVQDTAQRDARNNEQLKLLQLIRDEEAKINQAVQDTTISLTAQEHAQKAVAEAEKLKSDHQAARNIQNQEWAYVKAAEALDKQRSIQSEIDKLELKIANSRDKDTAYIEKQLAEERSRLVVQQELYDALVKRFNLDENSSRLSTRLVALDQQRVDAENALAEAQDRAVQSAAAEAEQQAYAQIVDWMKQQRDLQKEIYDLQVKYIETGSQDQSLMDRIDSRQRELNALTDIINKHIEENGILLDTKQIQDETARSIEVQRQGEEALATARQKAATADTTKRYQEATRNLQQQITLQKKIGDLEAKSVRSSNEMKVAYQQRIATLKTELLTLEKSYNQINQTNLSEEQQLAIQALIKQKEDEIKDAQLRVKAAVDQTNTSAASMQSALGNIVTGMQRSIGGMIVAIPMRMIYASIRNIVNGIKEGIQYCTEFYDKMNEIRVVTGMTVDEANNVGQSVRKMAAEMSTSSIAMADAAITFYRQGLGTEEVEKRMKATTEFANAAAIDFNEAAEYITSASNALGIEAEHVADVFLYLGDSAGTSGSEIGLAMSRAAATSQAVGISFESLGAMIAVVSEKTRQDAGSIGTALQSIMTRLANVKAKGFNEEDETKVNDVAKALDSVGIALTDGYGNWRKMDTIFMEVAEKWDSLDDKARAYLATVMAGTRQQNVFRTIMNDLSKMNSGLEESSRYMELLNGAMNSSGTAEEKFSVWAEKYKASQQRLAAEWEDFVSHMDITPLLKAINDGLADLLHLVNNGLPEPKDPYDEALEYFKYLSEGPIMPDVIQGGFFDNVSSVYDLEADLDAVGNGIARINELMEVSQRLGKDFNPDSLNGEGNLRAYYDAFFGDDGVYKHDVYLAWRKRAEEFQRQRDQAIEDGLLDENNLASDDFSKRYEEQFISSTDGISDETLDHTVTILNRKLDEALGDFSAYKPKVTKTFAQKFIDVLFPDGASDYSIAQETLPSGDNKFLTAIDEYATDYTNLLNSVRNAYSNAQASGVSGNLFGLMQQQIDAFNQKYQTKYKAMSLYDLLFPDDEQNVHAQISQRQAILDEQAQAIEDYYNEIVAGRAAAELELKKSGGFAEEVVELGTQLQSVKDAKDQEAAIKSLNTYYQDMRSTNKDLYDAMTKEFSAYWFTMMDALTDGDLEAAWAAYEQIVVASNEKAKKAMTDNEQAIQKWNDTVTQGVIKADVDAAKKSGFADWVTEYTGKLKEARDQLQLFQNENLNDAYAGYDALTSEWDKMSTTEEGRQWQSAFASFFGNDFYVLIDAIKNRNVKVIEETWAAIVKKSEEGAEKAETEWEKYVQKQKESTEKETLQAEQYGSWLTKMYEYMDAADAAGLFEWWSSQSETLREDFYQLYPALQPLLSALADDGNKDTFIETWAAQFANLRNNLPTKTDIEQIKKLNEESEKFVRAEELQQSKKNKFADERDTLWSYFDGRHQTAPDINGFYAQILKWQEDGTLDALYSGIEGLELLVSQLLVDMKDGTLNNVDLITQLNDLLFGTTTAWQRMGQAAKEALDNEITDAEGIGIVGGLLTAYDKSGIDGYREAFMSLSEAEQDYVSKNFEDHPKLLAGYEEETEALEGMRDAWENLKATVAENDGAAYTGTAKWMESATSGKGFFKQLESASKAATELSDGWEGLAILSGKLTDDTEILEQAMKQLSDATGLSVETLQGPNGLQQAEAVLMGQTQQAQYTIEMFGQALADAGYIRPEWGPVMSQLRTLAADTSTVQGRVAQFILAWNEASKLGDISLVLDVLGNFTAVGGGVLTGLEGTNKLLTGVAQNYIAGKTTAQTKVSSSSRSGGGGGGSSRDTSEDNLKTEIEKMIHLMEQLQELYDFEQSLIQAQRKDFEQDKLIQDQIATYQQESRAIEANNAVLQANIDKIEALLPGQQALVASMSTTDEKYKEASADLEKLQSTHQKYTKQLMENRTTIKEYAEAVDDLYDKIRDMEIDLRDTILEAIKDREALEESMRDARISMEDELFDLIKKRYERERDMIIDNATTKREALKEEQNLLDENLAKRKAAAEQEDKQAELLKLQQKLIRISADPTRRADQLALQKQIAELQDELAWDEADREVEAQKESLDKQIMNLDDYMDYVKRYYEDLFEHPQKLLAEVEALMSKTDAEIIAWLKANNDEFGKSTEAAQTKMVDGWEATLIQMHGDIITYWDEVESIIQQGDDAIIEFLKTNSSKYREASQFQAQAYVDGWKEQLEDLRLAYLRTYEEISAYDYSTIRLDESSSSSSSSSSKSGGGSSKSNTTTKSTSQPINPTMKEIAGALYGLTPIVTSGTGKDTIKTSTGTQYYDPWSREYVSTSGTRGTGDGSTSDSKVRLNALATGSTLKNLFNQQSSTLGQVTFTKAQPVKSVVKFGSGGETGNGEGLAYLHSKERVLNPYETKLFDTLVESLHRMERLSFPSMNLSSVQPEVVNNQPTFGDIVINVDSLSEDADYDEVADKIMEVISDRMNFGRAVGGVTRPR